MTSATNPENGTVTYTYDGAHRVRTRIDAKGQKTQFTYDQYGRKTMVQHFNASQVEITNQHGITGQKLTTYQCGCNDQTGGNGLFWYQVKSRNVYFGGKLMRAAGVTVVTDRLFRAEDSVLRE